MTVGSLAYCCAALSGNYIYKALANFSTFSNSPDLTLSKTVQMLSRIN